MPEPRQAILTGGCQCGTVRYALLSEPTNASICHCRMCQKAFGSYFAPLTGVPPKQVNGVWKETILFCRPHTSAGGRKISVPS